MKEKSAMKRLKRETKERKKNQQKEKKKGQKHTFNILHFTVKIYHEINNILYSSIRYTF